MANVKNMNLEEKIAQMLVVDLDNKTPEDKIIKMIKTNKIGGLLLFKKLYGNDYNKMLSCINKYKQANRENDIPLFISVDQEGGRVNRMPEQIHNLRSAFYFSKTGDVNVVKQTGSLIGKMLLASGINMNYAPVFDVKRFDDNHPIGNRCYGETVEEVLKYAVPVMNAIKEENVIPVIKHFPGHGATSKDTHKFLCRINKSIKELEEEDIKSFNLAIENGCDAIMVGHLVVNKIDNKRPASLSKKVIRDYLVNKKDFNGIIVTDDLKMGAIRLLYRPEVAAYKAIEAGNDLILVGLQTRRISKVIKYIARKVKNGSITEDRINRSVEKILELKEKYNVNDNEAKGVNIDEINREIDKLNSYVK